MMHCRNTAYFQYKPIFCHCYEREGPRWRDPHVWQKRYN